jgi:galactonate dehydratase
VRVETSDGLVGWGEGTLEGHTEAVEGVFEEFRQRFIGADADNIEDIWQCGYRGGFYRGGPVLMVSASLICMLYKDDYMHSSPNY